MAQSDLSFLDIHPFIREGVLDRVRGTIFGGALGDAVGLYTGVWPETHTPQKLMQAEFLSKDLLRAAYPDRRFQLVDPATELRNDGHRNKFVKTAWTDDTDHALLIVLSYLHNARLDSLDFARRLQFWCEQGLRCLDRLPLGLGRTVGRVVCDRRFVDGPSETAYRYWKTSNYTSAANGSLMRTAPLGIICLGKTREETFNIAAEFSSITHPDPRCIVACGLVTTLIGDILDGQLRVEKDLDRSISSAEACFEEWISRQDIAVEEAAMYPEFEHEEYQKHVSAESLEELELDAGTKMGYVYKALGAGIFVLRQGIRRVNSGELPEGLFEELITSLVLQGGDADTNATVAGALLGALLGYKSLPPKWKDGLLHGRWLFQKSDALASVLGIHPFPFYDSESDPDNKLDGGKPRLTQDQLERREQEFVKGYLAKSGPQADQKQTGWVSRLFWRAAAWPLEGGM